MPFLQSLHGLHDFRSDIKWALWLQLTGTMPPWSGFTMPHLRQLSVDSNRLEGGIPMELIRCALASTQLSIGLAQLALCRCCRICL